MTKKKKKIAPLVELHWSTNREKIEEILRSLNPKYLLGRLEYHDDYICTVELDEEELKNKPKYTVRIKYSGYTFTCSKRTLTKECERRCKEGTMTAVEDMKLRNSRSRQCRFGYSTKDKNGEELLAFSKPIELWHDF